MVSTTDTSLSIIDNDTEEFVLVWLDTRTPETIASEETPDETAERQSQLQTIINYTRTFNDADDCRTFIQSAKTEKIFLITCGYLGESLVTTIHDLRQLEVIYIFCINRRKYNVWSEPYSKVRAVCTTTNELLIALSQDVSMHAKNLTSWSVFNADLNKEVSLRSLKDEEVRFIWFHLLLELLLHIPPNETARNDMRNECERAYRGNPGELKKINEFFQTYTSESCIHWYTKDSFIYCLLNKAFRTENIDIIFKFRFFIVDLYHQIKQLHRPFTGTLFRGQTMSVQELQVLKNNKNKLVSVNTFFPATKSSNRAMEFSGQGTGLPQLESVVFEIDVNEYTKDTQPFVDIAHLGSMLDEDEVLFSINTIFRLVEVKKCDSIWIIHLVLSNENEQKFKNLIDHFKKELDEYQVPSLLMLGEFLWKMGDYNRANRYYQMMLRELSPNHELIGKIYNKIGLITLKNGNFRLAMDYFDKALRLQHWTETLDIAETYSNIGVLYDQHGETDQAIDFNKKALDIRLRLLRPDHMLLGLTYNNIGLVYFHRREYDQAFEYYEKARLIQQAALNSLDHFEHAATLSNIGLVYYEQGKYDFALSFFKEALAIQERLLPAQHLDFSDSYTNIGSAQEQLGNLNEAFIMFEKAFEIRLVALLPDIPKISEALNNLTHVLDTLDKSNKALKIYFKALKYIRGESIEILRLRAIILNNLAEILRQQENFIEATKYHQEALRIRLKLFSRKKDPDLAVSYNNIGLLFYYQRMFDKSLRYHFRSLAIRREIYESDHPRVARSLFNIALVYSGKGQYETALDYLRQALDIKKRTLPTGHESIKTAEDEISFIMQKQNEKK